MGKFYYFCFCFTYPVLDKSVRDKINCQAQTEPGLAAQNRDPLFISATLSPF